MKKIKTYVITLSSNFLKGHPKAGAETHFKEKFLLSQKCPNCAEDQDLSGENISQCNSCIRACYYPKIHTMRSNYPLWNNRIKEVQEGKAILSIRGWSDKPYNSKQYVIANLDKNSGIGIQKAIVSVHGPLSSLTCMIDGNEVDPFVFAKNDGLTLDDFADWFLPELTGLKEGGVIHFTEFRY